MARRAKHWTWTLNNPTNEEEQGICNAFPGNGLVYHVFGREVGNSGTPHLQGYSIFESQVRFSTVKSRLGTNRLHLEVSRGSPQQNKDYCTKDGNFEEFGVLPETNQGRRTDLESFFDWAKTFGDDKKRPPTTPEACREHPVVMTKYRGALDTVRRSFEWDVPVAEEQLHAWQQDLADEIASEPDDRSITFVIDPEGGKGKSWFVRWYLERNREDTQFLSVAKRDDMAHVVKEQSRVFLVDVPRGQMEFLRQEVLEQLKNRMVFSPKYNSTTKYLFQCPHVIVMCNEDPEIVLTEDRYNFKRI